MPLTLAAFKSMPGNKLCIATNIASSLSVFMLFVRARAYALFFFFSIRLKTSSFFFFFCHFILASRCSKCTSIYILNVSLYNFPFNITIRYIQYIVISINIPFEHFNVTQLVFGFLISLAHSMHTKTGKTKSGNLIWANEYRTKIKTKQSSMHIIWIKKHQKYSIPSSPSPPLVKPSNWSRKKFLWIPKESCIFH